MYNSILVPTDGNEPAVQAAVHAFNLAKWHNASVYVLYVVKEPPAGLMDGADVFGKPGVTTHVGDIRPVLKEMGTQATDDLMALADELDVEVAAEILTGQPDETICDFVEEHDIDLIVMGTHGRSGVERVLHGSVTERVLRSTDVPLLAIHVNEDTDK